MPQRSKVNPKNQTCPAHVHERGVLRLDLPGIYIPTTGQSILSIGKHASSSVGEAIIDSRRPVYIDLSSTSASDLFAWISVLYTRGVTVDNFLVVGGLKK